VRALRRACVSGSGLSTPGDAQREALLAMHVRWPDALLAKANSCFVYFQAKRHIAVSENQQ